MFLLASVICSNSVTTAFADAITYGSDDPVMYQTVTDKSEDKSPVTEVKASIKSAYEVTLPKTMSVNNGCNAYTVNAKGDLAGNEKITVVPDATVSLSSEGKDAVVGNITQEKQEFTYVDASKKTDGVLTGTDADGNININGLTAGHWSGIFNFNVGTNKYVPVSVNLSIDKASAKVNETVVLTANATNGKAPYQYKFKIRKKDAPKWTDLTDYIESDTYSWVVPKADNYEFSVDVKDETENIVTENTTDNNDIHIHKYTESIVKNPTCEEKGLKQFTCEADGDTYTEDIPATGHHYETPTYTWSNDKSTCTAKRVCKADCKTETETVNTTNVVTKNSTCETSGVKTYTATFKNPAFSTQTTISSIPATGHNYGTPTYTWSNNGLTCTAKRVCQADGKIETETVNATSQITKSATCENTGVKTFTAVFRNPAFSMQTITSTIPATGHNYGAPTYRWSDDGLTCTAKRVCQSDGKTETETVNATSQINQSATCGNTGVKTFTAVFRNPAFSIQTITSTIPALGHKYGEPTYVWNDDGSYCTAMRSCIRCSLMETETVKARIYISKKGGHTCSEAIFYNPVFKRQSFIHWHD